MTTFTMPSTQKAPSTRRKKVTASARARISTQKAKRQSTKHLGESYIQQSIPTDVNTIPRTQDSDLTLSQGNSSATIISMLNKLSESNQALLARVESLEERQSNENIHTNQVSGSNISSQRYANPVPDVMLGG